MSNSLISTKKRIILEEKIIEFSKDLFKNPILAISFTIAINLFYLYIIIKKINLISMISYIFLFYLISIIFFTKFLGIDNKE